MVKNNLTNKLKNLVKITAVALPLTIASYFSSAQTNNDLEKNKSAYEKNKDDSGKYDSTPSSTQIPEYESTQSSTQIPEYDSAMINGKMIYSVLGKNGKRIYSGGINTENDNKYYDIEEKQWKEIKDKEGFFKNTWNSFRNIWRSSSSGDSSRLGYFYGDRVLDAHNSPNYKNPVEDFTLDYYGSGDADKNDTLDIRDKIAMQTGTKNDRTDINGDGITNSQDNQLLNKYLTKQIKYLPAHWDLLRVQSERNFWTDKTKAIDKTDEKTYIPNDFDCDGFSEETGINFAGIERIWNSGVFFNYIDTTNNMRFNIPLYRVTSTTSTGIAHRMNAVLTGNDIANFNDWYFIEPQNDSKVVPGDLSMNKNEPVSIDRLCYVYSIFEKKFTYGYYPLIDFNLSNGVPSVAYQNSKAVQKRKLIPIYFNNERLPADTTLEFGISSDTSKTGIPKNIYEKAFIQIIDSSTQKMDGTINQVNFDISRYFKIYNHRLVDTTIGPQLIQIRDTQKPTVQIPNNIELLYGSDLSPNSTGKPVFSDNSGLPVTWTFSDSSTKSLDSLICDYYNYEIYRTFRGEDVAGNSITSTAQKIEVQKPNTLVFKYFPSDTSVINKTNLSPDSLNGWAKVGDLLIPGYIANVSFEDKTIDSNETQKRIKRTYTGKGICPIDFIQKYQFITSNMVGLEEDSYLNSLKIYPNPIKDKFTLEGVVSNQKKVTWQLFDLNGKLMDFGKDQWYAGENSEQIEVQNLSRGMYFLDVQVGDRHKNFKIVR